jgi:methionyl-tRNA synthetase
MKRVEPAATQALLAASRESMRAPAVTAPAPAGDGSPAEIAIEDFLKVDLRVARIESAEYVEGADKLLKLTLDLGDGQRQVFSGIRTAYDPESLAGRLTVVVANLKPRRMRFGVSEGMVLAAADGDGVFLIAPDTGAKPGMRVT